MATIYTFGTIYANLIYAPSTRDPANLYDQVIFGYGGADIIYAGDGFDQMWANVGDASSVTFFGMGGNDFLISYDGNDWLQGDAGDDTLFSGAGNDTLIGGDGSDWLQAGTGNDKLLGGGGNDVLWGEDGNDELWGETGADSLYGGVGDDILVCANDGLLLTDALWGGDGADLLITGNANDFLYGEAGNDRLWGGGGADYLYGGAGGDTLVGEDGDDYLEGGMQDGARDILIGGAGADLYLTDGVRNHTFGQNELVDWVWGFNAAEGDRIKLDAREQASESSIAVVNAMIDGVVGTMIVASIITTTYRPGLSTYQLDPAIFLAGVSLTRADLLDSHALIFA